MVTPRSGFQLLKGCSGFRGLAAKVLLCALLYSAVGVHAGCGGRRLLQTGAPAANTTNDAGGPVEFIETVEVDVVSQECVILYNAYYEASSPGVAELMRPQDNLQPSARECCSSCHDSEACNAWQWCPQQGGCPVVGRNLTFPWHGCQLIDLSGFLAGSVNTGQIKQQGRGVPFTSGSPLFFSVPKLPRYDVEIGRNFGGKFNYTCAASLVDGSCVLEGTAQSLGAQCDADPACLAISFYPKGGVWAPARSYGVLKGGRNVRLTTSDTELNPNAAIYIKLQPMGDAAGVDAAGDSGGDDGGGGGSDGAVIAAVVSSVVGTAAIAAIVLVYVYLRYRRLKAAVADDLKPGGAGSGSGDGSSGELEAGAGVSTAAAAGASAAGSDGGSSRVLGAHGGGSAGASDVSAQDEMLGAAAAAAYRSSGKKGAGVDSGSPPSVVDAHSGSSASAAGTGQAPSSGYSPFMAMSPQQLIAAVGGAALPAVAVVAVSQTSSDGSSQAGAWQPYLQQPPPQSQQQQYQQHPGVQQQQQQPMVVEVQQAGTVGGGGGGGFAGQMPSSGGGAAAAGERSARLSSSLQQAGTARELLEVFARMYSQRPAVDYAVVAQMLDQDADPSAVAAAERADEECLLRVDAVATRRRLAGISGGSAPTSGSPAGAAGAWQQQQQDMHQRDMQQQDPQPQQQQQARPLQQPPQQSGDGAAVAPLAAPPTEGQTGAAQGPAAARGTSQLEQEQSLLPGMVSPVSSMLPPASEWALQPEEVEICKRPDGTYWQLGTGAFGTCYKGLYHGKQLVAVKVLHRLEERRRGEEFEREVALLKHMRNRNIVQFIGACLDGPTPMLVTEFLEFGDLWRALPLTNAAGQRIFAWHKRGRRVLYDVAKGLTYLHHRRIVHLDLKSANILLSRHGTAKICDIGMARVLGSKEYLSMLSGVMGTFAWSAPEVLSGKRCTEKVDLYSFGVVIWEVCTGDVPVRGEMRPLEAPADCPQPVVDLYNRCISEAPEERPTAMELLQLLEAML